MDFADSPEHAAFRAEFRHWLETAGCSGSAPTATATTK